MGKQRTECGAYSDENFNDGSKDKIRNVDWGPYEGNATPRNTTVNVDSNRYNDIGEEGDGFNKPGYSGVLSRFKNHPK
jgi:hypothetical protein